MTHADAARLALDINAQLAAGAGGGSATLRKQAQGQ
jgi:hypothetical protein